MSGRIVAEFQQVDVRLVEKKIVLHGEWLNSSWIPGTLPSAESFCELISRTLRNVCATTSQSRLAATDSVRPAALRPRKSFRFLFCRVHRTADASRPQH